MSCEKFGEKLSAYVDGELGYESRVELEKHLLECRDCSERLEEMRRIESYRHLIEPPRPSREKWNECWEDIKKQTTDSLSAEKVRERVASRRKAHVLRRVLAGLGAAVAAAIVLAVVFWPGAPRVVEIPDIGQQESVCVLDYDDANYNLYVIDNPDYTIIKLIPIENHKGG